MHLPWPYDLHINKDKAAAQLISAPGTSTMAADKKIPSISCPFLSASRCLKHVSATSACTLMERRNADSKTYTGSM